MNNTRIGVDLAKDVIQVCIYANNKVRSNKEMTQQEFSLWLINTKTTIIIFEACGTSNYWHQVAISLGHDARLISPKFVSGKNIKQQQLQSIMRLRELAIKHKTALSNH